MPDLCLSLLPESGMDCRFMSMEFDLVLMVRLETVRAQHDNNDP